MKFIYLTVFYSIIYSVPSFAQLTNGSIAPNFTLTDLDGNSHQLYDYLDQGKSVLLDFFAVWCAPCQTHAPILNTAYQTYGPNGSNSMMFFALESDNSTTNNQCENYNGFPWGSLVSYPMVNATGSVPDDFAVNFYPTIYIVCPDRMITEVGQIGISEIGDFIDLNCEVEPSNNDLEITNLLLNLAPCSQESIASVEITNVGINIMSNPEITVFIDNMLIDIIEWQGNLQPSSSVTVELNSLGDLSIGAHIIELELYVDDNLYNNSIVKEFNLNQFISSEINFSLQLNQQPGHVSWEVINEEMEVIYSGADYGIALGTDSVSFNLPEGCYNFNIFDSNGNSSGVYYSLSTDQNIISGGDFGGSEFISFYVGEIDILMTQDIYFPEGWSIFSSYVMPEDSDFETIVNPIKSNLIIAKDFLGSAYLPEWDYNGIGQFQFDQGYQVKTTESCLLSLYGIYSKPEYMPLELFAGWNIISYLRFNSAPANLVFQDLNEQGNIVIAKDAYGAAYLPEFDYNGIGDIEPGKGYQLKTLNEGVLIYLSNELEYE